MNTEQLPLTPGKHYTGAELIATLKSHYGIDYHAAVDRINSLIMLKKLRIEHSNQPGYNYATEYVMA